MADDEGRNSRGDRKSPCGRCRRRARCSNPCRALRRLLPGRSPCVSLFAPVSFREDLGDLGGKLPREFAGRGPQRLLALADSIRSRFTPSQRRAMDLLWGRGLRPNEAAEIEGVSPSAIRWRMARVARILRRRFAPGKERG